LINNNYIFSVKDVPCSIVIQNEVIYLVWGTKYDGAEDG